MKALLATTTFVASLCLSTAALAQEGGTTEATGGTEGNAAVAPATGEGVAAAPEHEEAPPHAPNHLVFGVVGTGLITTAFADSLEINGALGGGLFAEWTAVPEWLAIELDVRVIASHEGTEFVAEMPIDLLLKKPIELTEKLEIYFGIGGTVIPQFGMETHVVGGLASVVGGYYWLTRHVALVGELDYNLIFGADMGRIIQEVGGSFGIALGV